MTFQRERVVMVGRGIENHGQPHGQFPSVADGNHLRWSFDPAVGFADHGYYLFRREHVGDEIDPTSVEDYVEGGGATTTTYSVSTPNGPITFTSDRPQSFVSGGGLAVDVDPGPVEVEFPEPVFEVALDIRVSDTTEVRAVAGDVTVDSAVLETTGTARVSFDRIESVVIEGGRATLVDVLFYPVSAGYVAEWKPVPGFNGPVTLPLQHPDYPATGGTGQDLSTARTWARDRIAYGDPAHYTKPRETLDRGTVDVQSGSAVVTGAGTDWSTDLAGRTFRVGGDDTAYVVTEVRPRENSPDELLLSRPYEGTTATEQDYELADDRFGQLHDYLVHLVDEGDSAGGQLGRALPMPIEGAGRAEVTNDKSEVDGTNTNWREELRGLYVQFATEWDGTVEVATGDRTVRREPGSTSDPAWSADLAGKAIRFGDQRAVYTVAATDTGDPNTLELDRAYAGPDRSGSSFAVYESARYRIEAVQPGPETLELATPYQGSTGTTRYLITGAFGPQGQEATAPWQSPLELALLGSVDPAIAQALGLYWIDEDADPDTSYDYLLLADHTGRVGEQLERSETISPEVLELRYDDAVDGYVTFDVQRGQAPPLDAPTGTEVHDLPPSPPEAHRTPDGTRYGTNTAGISWDEGPGAQGALLPDDAVQYHLWRYDFDTDSQPPAAPPATEYDPLTAPAVADADRADPVMVSSADVADVEGWPAAPIHTVDRGLLDGWYSYRVSGVDLFGRASEPSDPADWIEDGTVAHQSAIELLDDRAPPAPRQVEAEVLDVEQPVAGTGEARVRWIWPETYQAQAPDATEFRIQYYPGQLNEQFGEITAVTPQYGSGYEIETDIPALSPADGYVGATLQVGDASYEIVESDAAGDGTLTVELWDHRPDPKQTVETSDGTKEIAIADSRPGAATDRESPTASLDAAIKRDPPDVGASCTVSIPPVYREGTVNVTDGDLIVWGVNTDWTGALAGQSFTTPDGQEYTIASVQARDKLELESPYVVPGADEKRTRFDYAIEHPVRVDYNDPDAWATPTVPSDWRSTYATVDIGDYDEQVAASDQDNPLDIDYRAYETTIPIPKVGDPPTDPFATSEAEPVTYAHVGVNTVDRRGNAGQVSAPVTLTRVFEEVPEPPAQPSFESSIDYATPPGYDGESKYTVRFVHPGDHRRVHVYRAMDKAIFRADYNRRQAGEATRTLDPDQTDLFPPYRRDSSTLARREEIRDAIQSLHDAVTSESNFEDALAHYRDLEPDVLQTLAGLDGTESAYTQRTMDALDPDDHPNRKGPDFEAGDPGPNYQPGANAPDSAVAGGDLCAWVDSFDGTSRRRYFYRTGTVNEAGTRSDGLSYPTRPVQAVDTVPPTPPRLSKITAGHADPNESDHGAITLRWSPSPERDVEKYTVYRAADRDDAEDIRLMQAVGTVSHTDSDEIVWTDEGPPLLERVFYRVVAEDDNGNQSDPSGLSSARAVDPSLPSPPAPSATWTADGNGGQEIEITWSSANETLLQRRPASGGGWKPVTNWLPPDSHTVSDSSVDPSAGYEYRLRARKATGAIGAGTATTISST